MNTEDFEITFGANAHQSAGFEKNDKILIYMTLFEKKKIKL